MLAELENPDKKSWAFQELIGQPRFWTPRMRVKNVTAAYIVAPLDGLVRANGTFAVTLYSPVGNDGNYHTIKNIGSGTITLTGDIDADASISMAAQYDSVTVVSNGTTWDRI